MQAVEKADANGIFMALAKSLFRRNIDVTADCASVNTGDAKMRSEWAPSIIMVRCLAHRLELAMKDGFKADAHYDEVISLLSGVYAFYHNSPLQRAGLKASFGALGAQAVMPTRIGGTRWVSHTALALEKLWKAT